MTKQEAMNEAAEAELYRLEGVVLTRTVIREVFLNGWLAAEAAAMERPLMVLDLDFQNESRNALGTIGEGMATLLANHRDLAAAGLRGSDRGVAILKHLQEIGDNVRGVGSAIGDKFGVVLDAIKHVGETTEAVLDQVMPQEDTEAYDYSHGIHDDSGKYLPCSKAVYELFLSRGVTEPMHADVKADPTSGLGKLWADVPVKLEDVSDETLRDLWRSEQIDTRRFVEEQDRRDKIAIGIDPAHGADAMAYAFMRKDEAAKEPFELSDLRRQLETAKMLEAFWRKTAATRGERIKSLGDQVMDMGEMMDRLTGRITGA